MSREMSQNDLSRNSTFWHGNQLPFDVPAGLGLLDEDFELPEERDSQNNSVEEAIIPVTQTQRQPVFPLTQPQPQQQSQSQSPRMLSAENNDRPLLDPYSPTSPNDTYASPTAYQPLPQHIPPHMPPDSRYLYLPTYMNHPHYNHMMNSEYFSKFMAEEDKRRRNTAASARFRIKKKMREQALEKTARDMTTKAEILENRVRELEREIKWLKNLLIEKGSRNLDVHYSDLNKQDGGNKNGNINSKNNKDLGKSDQQHQK